MLEEWTILWPILLKEAAPESVKPGDDLEKAGRVLLAVPCFDNRSATVLEVCTAVREETRGITHHNWKRRGLCYKECLFSGAHNCPKTMARPELRLPSGDNFNAPQIGIMSAGSD